MPELPHNEHVPRYGLRLGTSLYVWKEALDPVSVARYTLQTRVTKGVTIGVLVSVVLSVAWLLMLWATEGNLQLFSPSKTGFAVGGFLLLGSLFLFRLLQQSTGRPQMPAGPLLEEAVVEPIDPSLVGSPLDIAPVYTEPARQAVFSAYELAARFSHASVQPLHLFVGAMSTDQGAVFFGRLGLRFDDVKEALGRRLQTFSPASQVELSPDAEQGLLQAFLLAAKQRQLAVSPIELLQVAYEQDPFLQEVLYDRGVTEEQVENVIAWLRIAQKLEDRYHQFRSASVFKPTGAMNRAMTAVATPFLDQVSENLTKAAVEGRLPFLVGRTTTLEEMFRVLESGRQGVLLVGPEGVGKQTLVAGVAERMVEEQVPTRLQDKRLVAVSIPTLLAGASVSEAQDRLGQVLVDAVRARNVVLVFFDIEQLLGSEGQLQDVAALLADVLSRTSLSVIATTTPEAYAQVIEKGVLGRVFEPVRVSEPSLQESIQIVEAKTARMEAEQKVFFSYAAVEKAVQLTDRYMHERHLPVKAIDVCHEVALQVRSSQGEGAIVQAKDVADLVAQKTSIPVNQATEDEKETLLHLEERIRERMVGQDEAVKTVSAALRRARAELRSTQRPMSTFLFLGPTGVGKTELAKTVAEVYFGSENTMLRFDMSEYQTPESIHRLLGGGAGGRTEGLLTETVRRNPFSLILLDEFEKAHPDLLNVFLQVFDDGRLTDVAGRTIDFTNTIIIATSNAGSEYIQEAIRSEDSVENIKTHLIEEELKGIYRPELLNRFDGVVVFRPLTKAEVLQITYLFINEVAERLEPKGIAFEATDTAVEELAEKGYDPAFGARPLRRVVQEEVDNAIATALLEGKVGRRDTIVLQPGGELDIRKADAL